ncbi:hypothetical protein B5E84_17460 [Lachnoclostridium sp. An14]|nr:hypothetical protein B5E84_17460 [Lachnoclostridium sp. An14]
MLRKEAHSAQRNMAAGAAALRRECAPSAHFFIHPREPGKIRSAAGHRRGVGLNKIALEGGAVNPRFLPREPLGAAAERLWRGRIPTGETDGRAGRGGRSVFCGSRAGEKGKRFAGAWLGASGPGGVFRKISKRFP